MSPRPSPATNWPTRSAGSPTGTRCFPSAWPVSCSTHSPARARRAASRRRVPGQKTPIKGAQRMAETWLRIVTYRTTQGSGEARKYLTDGLQDVLRQLGGTPGFRGGHWAHDPEGLTIAAVTNWGSRDA